MSRTLQLVLALPMALTLAVTPPLAGQARPTIAQFLSPASPLELVSARHADRLAWVAYERGMRNVYTAAGPDFKPVRLTRFLEDDGTELSDVAISDDGAIVVFVRGSAPNREGWVADPTHDPAGAERAIWAVRSRGGKAWRVTEGSSPALSPDGHFVLFEKDGQIFRAGVMPDGHPSAMDTAGVPFIREWGRQSAARWSPDGRRIAFVSERVNHSLIGIYDVATRSVHFLAPGVDCDADPVWSPDGKRIAFLRRPGVPFGRQAQTGSGGIGNPSGTAYNPQAARGRGTSPFGCGFGRFGGFGRRGGGPGGRGGAPGDSGQAAPRNETPGLYEATLDGGYTLALMVADPATGAAQAVWHNQPGDRVFGNIRSIRWTANSIVFPLDPPRDEWDRYWAIPLSGSNAEPVQLTTTDGLIENATSVALSPDGQTLYYCTNAGDIERRHIWAVPTAGGTPVQISQGHGVETYPAPLASGKQLAVLYFNARQPASVALVPAAGGEPKIIFPTLPEDFPQAQHVVPQIVLTQAADSLEIHNQLFLPADLRPGEKRPAMIFVHGGPIRQMLPAYHYMQFYHWAYAFNQWLANQGYVVLSINYRGGIGYGNSFRRAPNTNRRGNAEYQDVVAGARYLQGRPDVDPQRIGIWGLSYGGLLTAQALARNSDIFVAGADLAGVHLYGNSLDTADVSYQSSAISQIDKWTSPVFLVHGDDDRNVDFSQTVGLVQLLRAHHVHYELTVIPDDVHESLLHSRWIDIFNRMGDFFHRFVWDRSSAAQ